MLASSYMTITEAVAWIATKDAAFAAECRGGCDGRGVRGPRLSLAWSRLFLDWKEDPNGKRRPRRLRAAQKVLWSRCRDGRIVSKGLPGARQEASRRRRTIRPDEWADLAFHEDDDKFVLLGPQQGRPADWWRAVEFRRADVQEQFPPSVPPVKVLAAAPTLAKPASAAARPGKPKTKEAMVLKAVADLWPDGMLPMTTKIRDRTINAHLADRGPVSEKTIARALKARSS